jgi:hypothetical protein
MWFDPPWLDPKLGCFSASRFGNLDSQDQRQTAAFRSVGSPNYSSAHNSLKSCYLLSRHFMAKQQEVDFPTLPAAHPKLEEEMILQDADSRRPAG